MIEKYKHYTNNSIANLLAFVYNLYKFHAVWRGCIYVYYTRKQWKN